MLIEDESVKNVARRLAQTRPPEAGGAAGARPTGSSSSVLGEQPEVLAFLLAGTSQLSAEARAVAVFLGAVVFEAFRDAGRATRALATAGLVAALRRNRDMALRVGQAHDRFAERYLRNSRTLRQPALIRYVTGVLLEPEQTCPHTLDRAELGPLFIVLKSVIDVLDDDWQAARAAAEPGGRVADTSVAGLSSEPR